MAIQTLEQYRARQLELIEKWVIKHAEPYKLCTFDNYWKSLEINHATITGEHGELVPVLILNNEYTGLYCPGGLWDVWERIEQYIRHRALAGVQVEMRGCNQSMWIYF